MKKLFMVVLVALLAAVVLLPASVMAAPEKGMLVYNASEVKVSSADSFTITSPTKNALIQAPVNSYFFEKNGQIFLQTPDATTEIKVTPGAECRIKSPGYLDVSWGHYGNIDVLTVTMANSHYIHIVQTIFYDDGSWEVRFIDTPIM